jgi:hypothetical protein
MFGSEEYEERQGMAQSVRPADRPRHRFTRWLLEGQRPDIEGPYEKEKAAQQHTHPWWQIMCLTGVDYFSTLGYQPGIAALAAGALSPIATLVLVLLTLFGALPMYNRVAAESPHGDGSISMLERLLPWWQGKLFVLCLIGFVTTSFIITITLSAADATAHILENPLAPPWLHHEIVVTLILIALLGAVFLKGFKEAIGIAVGVVVVYILLSLLVVGVGFYQIAQSPVVVTNWYQALFAGHDNIFLMIGAALLLFPKLALGLSGFETGVVVMPLVRGDPKDTEEQPIGRIRNTRKLLTAAALIMSVMLISSSLVTTLLIPPEAFQEGGEANGRALAYLAHHYLGDIPGTLYDLSTIAILWFAGASAMAGLLNIVPRYLPRYGMAPEWTRATRPLVFIFIAICFVVTILFNADVDSQGGAYATGVLTLMGSAAVAVTLSAWRQGQRGLTIAFGFITLVFVYTIIVNVTERPDGIKIAGFFILSIIITSLVSRVWRSTELRSERVELDETARQFIAEASKSEIRIIANRRQRGDEREYLLKEREAREDNLIPSYEPVLFLELQVCDASEFSDVVEVKGVTVHGYNVLRAESSTVPNAIAAFLLYLRDTTGKIPHCYFTWSEGNPIRYLFKYIVLGEGDTAPLTREVLRKAEPNPERRPQIHVGG